MANKVCFAASIEGDEETLNPIFEEARKFILGKIYDQKDTFSYWRFTIGVQQNSFNFVDQCGKCFKEICQCNKQAVECDECKEVFCDDSCFRNHKCEKVELVNG